MDRHLIATKKGLHAPLSCCVHDHHLFFSWAAWSARSARAFAHQSVSLALETLALFEDMAGSLAALATGAANHDGWNTASLEKKFKGRASSAGALGFLDGF